MDVQTRKPGRKKESLHDESLEKLAQQTVMMIRRDYGGRDHAQTLQKRLTKRGAHLDLDVCRLMNDEIDDILKGCRKRITPRVREIIRRANGI